MNKGWFYTAYLSTLNEERSSSIKISLYKGNEICSSSRIWKNYEFDSLIKTKLDRRRNEDLYNNSTARGVFKTGKHWTNSL
jgi:hypothetical protein